MWQLSKNTRLRPSQAFKMTVEFPTNLTQLNFRNCILYDLKLYVVASLSMNYMLFQQKNLWNYYFSPIFNDSSLISDFTNDSKFLKVLVWKCLFKKKKKLNIKLGRAKRIVVRDQKVLQYSSNFLMDLGCAFCISIKC